MRLTCYGTGAAEAIPALYCACPVCQTAREEGGREVRSRHLSVVDGDIQFDNGPDFFYQAQVLGFEPLKVRHLIVTHAHSDHFQAENLLTRQLPYSLSDPAPLELIGSRTTLALWQAEPEANSEACKLLLREIKAFETLPLVPGTLLTALPARHAREFEPFIYVLERGGKALLYAHDTGLPEPELLAWLAGRGLDAATLDCTGAYLGAGSGHLALDTCDQLVAELRRSGAIKPEATILINHFSHGGGATHRQLEAEAAARGWIAAYDGITVDF